MSDLLSLAPLVVSTTMATIEARQWYAERRLARVCPRALKKLRSDHRADRLAGLEMLKAVLLRGPVGVQQRSGWDATLLKTLNAYVRENAPGPDVRAAYVLLHVLRVKASGEDPVERTPLANAALNVAAVLAGRNRVHLRDEWAAMLAGAPEQKITIAGWQRRRMIAGFVIAAGRMRLGDLTKPFWSPVDWILAMENRTNGLIALVVGAQAIYIVGDDGLGALMTEIWEPCGICGAALYVLARWLRRVRGIELAAVRTEDPPTE
ncbi:hypothetical protein [Streptomyces sp. BH105]|uniref:hypothetical protein n=1 Tax=Streptomyces sp. BH105 TaxID=3410408 RepID=UPI003CF1D154